MPLFPPQDYRKTAFTHRRGLAAARPAAADVLPGTLYFSTDTGVTERSNGSTWESYSGAGSGNIINNYITPPIFDGVDGDDALFGPQGSTGPQGNQGIPGRDGLPGIHGLDGEDGLDSFVPGPKGDTGSQGIQGLQGLQGIPGPSGIDGEDGLDSLVPGPQGIQGIQGLPGVSGSNGIDGIDGEDGLDSIIPGPTGPQGVQGVQGISGIQGIPGPSGQDAEEPEIPYLIPGPKGDTGPQGPAGSSGSGGGSSFPLYYEQDEPEFPYIIPGNNGKDGATAGTGPVSTIEVNLGSTPVWRGKFTITDASITTGTRVLVWQAPGPYTGKGKRADEAEFAPIHVIAVESFSGSCRVYWETLPIVVPGRNPQSQFLTSGTTVLNSPKDPQAIFGGPNIRLNKIKGNVKFSYMVCRNGGTSVFEVTTTGNIVDLDFGNANVIRFNNASLATLFTLKRGTAGQVVHIYATNAQVNLRYFSSGGGSQALLVNFAATAGSDTPLLFGSATYYYDAVLDQWRMIAHEQGRPITPTFAAGDFTGSGTMTWTVDSGDVRVDAYKIVGKTVQYQFYYETTTVGGVLSTDLRRALPSILTPAEADATVQWSRNLDNGTANDGFAYVGSSFGNFIFIRRDKTSGNWAAATNNTAVQGFLSWEIN